MRRLRSLTLAVLVGALLTLALPGLAAEEAPADGTTETTVQETIPPGSEPAVVLIDEAEPETLQPWTIRYLIPTSIAIAGILIFGTVVQYFLKVVRTRYKTVE